MPENSPESSLEKKPWGEELWISGNTPSMIKIITVNPGEALSLQFHHFRDEYWRIISGNGEAWIGIDEKVKLEAGSEIFVTRGIKHRIVGGTSPLVLLELAYGKFDQSDIVRLEDKYGRT